MSKRRCNANEHQYDASKYSECPFCRHTVQKGQEQPEAGSPRRPDEPTRRGSPSPKGSPTKVIFGKSDDEVVLSDSPPVVGWLVIIAGPGLGRDLRIAPNDNYIGRDPDMHICLDFGDQAISRRKHAILTYDPLNNDYSIQHGDGKNLTYVNGARVLAKSARTLQSHDRIRIGATELLFIPLCNENFCWAN